jgi:hypothetical protein
MLFLYRPRETWMPYTVPANISQQTAYNRQLQDRFESTRRVAPAVPAAADDDALGRLEKLAALHESGALTDAEFDSAKAKLLGR